MMNGVENISLPEGIKILVLDLINLYLWKQTFQIYKASDLQKNRNTILKTAFVFIHTWSAKLSKLLIKLPLAQINEQ